jgi:hypothetical protein
MNVGLLVGQRDPACNGIVLVATSLTKIDRINCFRTLSFIMDVLYSGLDKISHPRGHQPSDVKIRQTHTNHTHESIGHGHKPEGHAKQTDRQQRRTGLPKPCRQLPDNNPAACHCTLQLCVAQFKANISCSCTDMKPYNTSKLKAHPNQRLAVTARSASETPPHSPSS